MPVKDYYGALGVNREATTEEIKKAFRRKARETHPDVNGGHGDDARFKEVNEAYEVLSDPEKRRMYDRYGTADPRRGGQPGGPDPEDFFGFGVEDVFSAFFGGGFAGAAARQRPRREGRDMRASVTVTLEEAGSGVTKDVRVTRDAPCAACGATGAAEGGDVVTCPDCQGTGHLRSARRTLIGVMESLVQCPRCETTGVIVDDPCPRCSGSGRARVTEEVSVDVPAGVQDGTGIRVVGGGEAGVRGATAGDLVVTVRVEPHEFLHREGDDLHARVEIDVAQAALGATLTVPGLDGEESVGIPAGTQFGDTVRLRGRGMPRLARSDRGDFVAHVAVQVPRRLSKRQRELLEELGGELESKARSPLSRLVEWLGG